MFSYRQAAGGVALKLASQAICSLDASLSVQKDAGSTQHTSTGV
jgi:hypothetical protein